MDIGLKEGKGTSLSRLLTGAALLASFIASLVLAGAATVLAWVEQSGERAAGLALLAIAGVGFAAVLFLAFAPARLSQRRRYKAAFAAAALIGAAPVTALAVGAIAFVGAPLESAILWWIGPCLQPV